MVKVVRDIVFLIGVAIFLLVMVFFSGWITITLGNAHITTVKKSDFANAEGAFNIRQNDL